MLETAKLLMMAGAATTVIAVSALPASAASEGGVTASAYTNVRLEKVWGPSGICLSMNGKTASNAPLVQKKCTSGSDQKWTLKGTSAGIYTIKNKKSAKCLGISGTSSGTVITQRACNASSKTQQWYLADSKIHSKWAGKCLAFRFAVLSPHAVIVAFWPSGGANRQLAKELRIAERTVKAHIARIPEKLGYQTRLQTAVLAVLVHDMLCADTSCAC